jgi:hypothetical protein
MIEAENIVADGIAAAIVSRNAPQNCGAFLLQSLVFV